MKKLTYTDESLDKASLAMYWALDLIRTYQKNITEVMPTHAIPENIMKHIHEALAEAEVEEPEPEPEEDPTTKHGRRWNDAVEEILQ
jgi:hypothetical protein